MSVGPTCHFFYLSYFSLSSPLSLLFLSPARAALTARRALGRERPPVRCWRRGKPRGHAAPSPAPSAGGLRGAGVEADAGRRRGHSRARPSTPALWWRRRPYSSHAGLPPPGRGRRGGVWPWRGARARWIRRPWPLLPAAVRRGARAATRRCPDGAARPPYLQRRSRPLRVARPARPLRGSAERGGLARGGEARVRCHGLRTAAKPEHGVEAGVRHRGNNVGARGRRILGKNAVERGVAVAGVCAVELARCSGGGGRARAVLFLRPRARSARGGSVPGRLLPPLLEWGRGRREK
ncbi:hypothetical protein PVAP13_2KG096916 [Panicum virgatum]|uniref:Uncharacterized protein n=1 Tax=Panicum virgatum TaxID=38727 RepID=A0A8T0VZC5_PANVG|nr:hypothetical protein PVAP13_2KG096916 [Panicum virgatum]